MEPQAAVKCVEMIANSDEDVFLSDIIMDDDATTMAQLRHKSDGGHLSDNIPVPKKRGDVNHRIRGLGRQCEELASMPAARSRVNKAISSRVKKNFAYWIHSHRNKKTKVAEVFRTRFACVHHLFGEHDLCTPDCPALVAAEKEDDYVPKTPYLCNKMHSDIKQDLMGVVSFYTAMERLKELFFDDEEITDRGTQPNEAINNASITMAPKDICYSTSSSFSDRVYHMIGVHIFGHLNFFRPFLEKWNVHWTEG